jgi:hypothetical protein
VELLGGKEREIFAQWKARLRAKERVSPGAGAVAFELPLLEHLAQQLMILNHMAERLLREMGAEGEECLRGFFVLIPNLNLNLYLNPDESKSKIMIKIKSKGDGNRLATIGHCA